MQTASQHFSSAGARLSDVIKLMWGKWCCLCSMITCACYYTWVLENRSPPRRRFPVGERQLPEALPSHFSVASLVLLNAAAYSLLLLFDHRKLPTDKRWCFFYVCHSRVLLNVLAGVLFIVTETCVPVDAFMTTVSLCSARYLPLFTLLC